ncbi:MAG: methyl-accepting chemotaxis protein [bacterium]
MTNNSLQAKLLILVLAVTLSSIIVISYISISTLQNALESKALQQMVSIREVQKSALENQFNNYRKQIQTMAQSNYVIEAMKSFDKSFKSYPRELLQYEPQMTTQQRSKELRSYYTGDFSEEFQKRNGVSTDRVNEVFSRLSPEAIAFQHAFIADNPNPLGSKHLMDKPAHVERGEYAEFHANYHPYFRNFLEKFGYYDIFLVEPENGRVVYSVFKELDYATSLVDGPYSQSNFAAAFRAVQGSRNPDLVKMVDFDEYYPSYQSAASFLSVPIIDGDEPVGVLVFQIPIDQINTTMTNSGSWSSVGLGRSGETYMVSNDYSMRNDSRLLIEDPDSFFGNLQKQNIPAEKITRIRSLQSSILIQNAKSEATIRAIQGEKGTALVTNYLGNQVLSAFSPLKIPDVNWAIISEIEEAEVNEYTNELIMVIIAIAILISIVAMVITFFYVRSSLAKPLKQMVAQVQELEITKTLDLRRRDEIGQIANAIDLFTNRLFEIVTKIRDRAADISSSSQILAEGSQDLATRTEEQSSSLEETASAMEEMTSNVQQNAESANHANHISQNMREVVEERKSLLQTLLDQTISSNQSDIDKVRESNGEYFVKAEQMNDQMVMAMKGIGDSSEKISGITSVINDIAFQTNLLALNASVEAARAGEHGKGFAVVAAEVRNLAHRSAEASEEISTLIKNSLEQVAKGTSLMGEVNTVVQEMIQKADKALEALKENSRQNLEKLNNQTTDNLKEIQSAVSEVTDLIENIKAASNEQAEGIRQVNIAVSELDRITQQNALLVDESATTSRLMSDHSNELMKIIEVFKLEQIEYKPEEGSGTSQKLLTNTKNNQPSGGIRSSSSIDDGLPDFE